jgi:hypothetical protein
VPDYANDPVQAYAIGERMKQLGRSERYLLELSKTTKADKLHLNGPLPSSEAKRNQDFGEEVKAMG